MSINRQTSLSANIVAFCRYLRDHGFTIGPLQEQDALKAMEILAPYDEPEDLQLCLQTALCRSPQQLQAFPELYRKYWRELDRAVDSKTKDVEEEKEQTTVSQPQKAPSLQALKDWLYGNSSDDTTETATYSTVETAGNREYPPFDERELREIFALVKKLVRKIANRRSRRFTITRKKDQTDLKKTIRRNIIRHGEIVELMYKRKKKDNLKVVLLCDVSRSMELYSRFLIQFLFAFQSLFPKVTAFVFSTSLHTVSPELHLRSLDESLKRIIEKVNNWSGGTQIGTSLAEFNDRYAHKHLTTKTLTIILSDGWDTGEPDRIAEQMKQIHRRSLKVLWLNPLAGSPDWKPEVRGMKAAMPYIDALIPFHGVENITDMITNLKI